MNDFSKQETFHIGDRVAVRDQDITGTIIAISPNGSYATIADDDWQDWTDGETCEACENRLEFRLDDLEYSIHE